MFLIWLLQNLELFLKTFFSFFYLKYSFENFFILFFFQTLSAVPLSQHPCFPSGQILPASLPESSAVQNAACGQLCGSTLP